MNRYKVLGVNDDKDSCECCGKQGLKKVVWIEDTETQEIKHFGTTCAASPVKGFGVNKEIKQAVSAFDFEQQRFWRVIHRLYRKAGGKYAQVGEAFTPTNCDLFEQLINQAKAPTP